MLGSSEPTRSCLQVFNRTLAEMRGVDDLSATPWSSLVVDLGLTEYEAIVCVIRFLTQSDKFLGKVNIGFFNPVPEDLFTKCCIREFERECVVKIPISADGVELLLGARREELFTELFITRATTVRDVIGFLRGVEKLELSPKREFVSNI